MAEAEVEDTGVGRDVSPSLLIVTTTNQRRGAEIQAERSAEALSRRGWHVDLRSLSSSSPPVTSARTVSDRSSSDLRGLSLPVLRSLRAAIRDTAPDVFLAWGSATLRYTAIATLALASKPAMGYVAIGSPSGWVRTKAQRTRYRALVSRYDVVVAVSERTRSELVELIGVAPARIHVVRSGIPSEYFDVVDDPSGTEFRVLFAGSLSDEKDPLAALDAVTAVPAAANVRLRFVGSGPLGDTIRREVERRGMSSSVELAGPSADVASHLSWADALLLTSRTEGLPGIVIEAAAAGVPVVAFDVGAVSEIVEDGSSGILVPAGDAAAASAALTRLATDADLRESFASRGRTVAGDRYSIDGAAMTLDRVLRSRLL